MMNEADITSRHQAPITDRQALIDVRGLSKHFGGLPAVDDVALRVDAGEVVALIGPNGAGKSTVLNLLAGLHPPTACSWQHLDGDDMSTWTVEQRRHAGLAYTSQTPRTFASMTVYDDVATGAMFGRGHTTQDAHARCSEAIAALDLSTMTNLRSGQLNLANRRRVELARALVSAPRVLLLDEPLAGLDDATAAQLLAVIVARQIDADGAVLWVEHNLQVVRDHASRVLVMDHGRIIADGPPHDALADPQVITAYVGRRRHQPAGPDPSAGPAAVVDPAIDRSPLLTLTAVTVASGATTVVREVDLAVATGDVVALLGPNGAGKTSLLRVIAGLSEPVGGTIDFDGCDLREVPAHGRARLGVTYVPSERHLFPAMTVADHLILGANARRLADQAAMGRLGRDEVFALFPRLAERTLQHAGTLSGGEQQMLAIARALLANPRVLLLDEPSAGLAPQLLDELYRALAELRTQRAMAIVIAEQFIGHVSRLATATYLVDRGHVRLATAADRAHIVDAYLANLPASPPPVDP